MVDAGAAGSVATPWGAPSLVVATPAMAAPGRPWRRLWLPLAGAYLAVGAALTVGSGVVMGDALARVANAGYAIAGRDPHLSAIGFVWSPLPTLATIPVLALRPAWDALATHGMAGVVVSAGCMAATVVEVHRAGVDLGVRRGARVAVVALVALHPMIVFYAGNGMSEAMFLLALVVAARHLSRWLHAGELGELVTTAMALAVAYLTRYEAVPAAMAAAAVVAAVSFQRTGGGWRYRSRLAVADLAVLLTPFVAAFALWALASWVIVGSPFEQFTSSYGNTSTVAVSEGPDASGTPLDLIARQVLVLEPLLPVLAVVGLGVAVLRRDLRVVAPLALLGAVAAFSVLSTASGATFGFLRFYLVVVPLAALVVLHLLAAPRPGRRRPGPLATLAACAALAVALPTTAAAFWDADVAPQELQVAAVFDPALADEHPGLVGQYTTERQIASYVDSLGLPEGSVLLDVRFGFPIVTASTRPDVFIVPADRDHDERLADPQGTGVRYLLAVPNGGQGVADNLNRAHPDLYAGGAGMATLVGEWANLTPTDPPWRLYRVLDQP